jgi:hypothetical protein
MKEIKEILDKYAGLLPLGENMVSTIEAERRAGEFLTALSYLANWRHLLSTHKIKALSIQTATYSEQMSKADSKQVTEKKAIAEAHPVYIEAREEFEKVENDLSFLKSYQEIFMNAHVFYRQLAKGEMQ